MLVLTLAFLYYTSSLFIYQHMNRNFFTNASFYGGYLLHKQSKHHLLAFFASIISGYYLERDTYNLEFILSDIKPHFPHLPASAFRFPELFPMHISSLKLALIKTP